MIEVDETYVGKYEDDDTPTKKGEVQIKMLFYQIMITKKGNSIINKN